MAQPSSLGLRGKVVLVTGAGRGIGAAIATAFAREGAIVAVNHLSNDAAAAQTVAACQTAGKDAGGDAWAVRADVGSQPAVQAMAESIVREAGAIDIVVNNAFRPYAFDPERRSRFDDLDWSDYQAQFDGAVGAAFNVCRAVLPQMRQRARGSIVNIASNLVEHPVVPYHDYTTAKPRWWPSAATWPASWVPWAYASTAWPRAWSTLPRAPGTRANPSANR
jgi:3-oxoacyl-[acyl-carrier protein] reductase